jgi:BirA family biotin operon repressor/biotin-[acetyl-CoA-carboxylase] ligase
LSFAAALAVVDTAAHFAPRAAITVKWPNDVLADGRKLSGILLESGPNWLAVGIGINLAEHPAETEFPATSLAALGATPPQPDVALTVLAARFAYWLALWRVQGFEPLRAAWLARAGGLGSPIRARLPQEERHGAFEGIDATGALLLREASGLRAITAGEVFF